MSPLELVNLTALMERSGGDSGVKIGLIDGPVFTEHADLAGGSLRGIRASDDIKCSPNGGAACLHGTFVAGILAAHRRSPAPGICPACTILIRPIFSDRNFGREQMPGTTPHTLAAAIGECIEAGARLINLSLALAQPSMRGERVLEEALNQALGRGVIIVAAAGNQSTVGSSAITRHPWVIPVAGCGRGGEPLSDSNISGSISRRGLRAPGEAVTSLGSAGEPLTLGGTSVAVPFVTGAIALLWSLFPTATAAQIKFVVCQETRRRSSVVPPLLNAAAAYQMLLKIKSGGQIL